jgi:hypothetical protein
LEKDIVARSPKERGYMIESVFSCFFSQPHSGVNKIEEELGLVASAAGGEAIFIPVSRLRPC